MQQGGQYRDPNIDIIKQQLKAGNLVEALSKFNGTMEGNQRAIANDPDVINDLLGYLKDSNKIAHVKTWLEKINPLLENNLVIEGVVKKAREIIERGDAAADLTATIYAGLSNKIDGLTFIGKNTEQREEALKEILIAIVNVGKDGLQNTEAIKGMLAKIRGKLDEATPDQTVKDRFEDAVKIVEKTFEVRRQALGMSAVVNVAAAEYDQDILRGVRAAADVYAVPNMGIGTGTQFFTAPEGLVEGAQLNRASVIPVQAAQNNIDLRAQAAGYNPNILAPISGVDVAPAISLDAAQGPMDARADRFAVLPEPETAAPSGIYPSQLIDERYGQLPLAPAGQFGPGVGFGPYPSGIAGQTMRLEEATRAIQVKAVRPQLSQRTEVFGPYPSGHPLQEQREASAVNAAAGAQQPVSVTPYTKVENIHVTDKGALAAQEQQKAQKKDGEIVKFFKSHEGARYTLGTLAVIAAFAAPPVAVAIAAALVINELSPILKPVVGVVLSIVVGTFEMLNNGAKAIANLGIALKNLFSAEKTPYYSMSMEGTKIVFNSFMSKSGEKEQAVSSPKSTPAAIRTAESPQHTIPAQTAAPTRAPSVGCYQAIEAEGYPQNVGTVQRYDTVAPLQDIAVAARPHSLDVPAEQRYASAATIQQDLRAAAVTIASGVVAQNSAQRVNASSAAASSRRSDSQDASIQY